MNNKETLRGAIRINYAKIARKSAKGCCGSGCGCEGTPDTTAAYTQMIGYRQDDILGVPADANMNLGCGNPLALASLREGETVLDLGSGGGLDCFLASRSVGERGYVIGVDMTPDMIALALSNAEKHGYKNVEFRLGEIEHLPVADNSIDVILSNCVINLSIDKRQVYREAYRVLKPGGRLSISDVVSLKPLPEEAKNDVSLVCGCIGGAETAENVRAMLLDAGFEDIDIEPKEQSSNIIRSWGFQGRPEDYAVSCDIRAEKPEEAERC